MGYQLVFWQQAGDQECSPEEIHRLLMDGTPPPGLRSLPVESILSDLAEALPGLETIHDASQAVWEGADSVIVEVEWSSLYLVAELRGAWRGEVANGVIDVLARFGCPLFDPQTNKRFDSWTT